MRSTTLALLAVLCVAGSSMATAAVIVVEPDMYSAGTDLSNVSPFVNIRTGGFYISDDGTVQGRTPVFATPQLGAYEAPTGQLTFGRHPWVLFPPEDTIEGHFGLGFLFQQPVSLITLLAQNDVEGFLPVLARWSAFDRSGTLLAIGSTSGNSGGAPGEVFRVTIDLPDIWSLVIGSSDGSGVMVFDQLRFQVPEPPTLALLGLGLVGMCYARRRKAS